MDYVKLGRTGLDVSRICLGCMSFGISGRGNHAWTLDEDGLAAIEAKLSAEEVVLLEEPYVPHAIAGFI